MRPSHAEAIRMLYAALLTVVLGAVSAWTCYNLVAGKAIVSLFAEDADVEMTISNSMPHRQLMLLPYRVVNKRLGRRFYADTGHLVVDEGLLLPRSLELMETAAPEHVKALYDACCAEDRNFLYVLCPGKPLSDDDIRPYGVPCYRNESADLLLQQFDAYGVPYVDLRPVIREAGLAQGDPYALFYKSDHHWTADAGLIAARTVATALNDRYGLGLNTDAISEDNMAREVQQEAFVGEMGAKGLGALGATDHLVIWRPTYEAQLHYVEPHRSVDATGDFDIIFDQNTLKSDPLLGNPNRYYAFMGGNGHLGYIENASGNENNILLVKDSFSCVVTPYLALTTGKVTWWDMRESEGQSITAYLHEHPEIKTVVILYNISFAVGEAMNDYH